MKAPDGRHRGPVDRGLGRSKTRNLTLAQRIALRAFVEGLGRAKVATAGSSTIGHPGQLIAPVRVFDRMRRYGWVAIDESRNATDGVGHWLLTTEGRTAFSRGWYFPTLSDRKPP